MKYELSEIQMLRNNGNEENNNNLLLSTKIYQLYKLIIPKTSGFMNYNNIEFHLTRNCNEVYWPWKNTPAINRITTTLNGEWEGLTVFTKKDVPEEYLDIIIAHEVINGNERLNNYRSRSASHKIATNFHMSYARKFKNRETLEKFIKWQSQFECYKNIK